MGADNKHRAAGFTLLELLIALVLATLVLLTLSTAGGFVIRQWFAEKDSLGDSLDTALLALRLERAVTGAYPLVYTEKDKKGVKKKIFFQGTDNGMCWASTVSPGHPYGLGGWCLQQEDAGVQLRFYPSVTGDPMQNIHRQKPIWSMDKATLDLRYLAEKSGRQNDTKAARWVSSWSGPKKRSLPVAVRLTIKDAAGDSRIRLVVPIPARTNSLVRSRPASSGPSTGAPRKQNTVFGIQSGATPLSSHPQLPGGSGVSGSGGLALPVK